MSDAIESVYTLHTGAGDFPLHEYHLRLGDREWSILHTGLILTCADEIALYRDTGGHMPFGVALWPSAIALAHELASRADTLRGHTLLELGAGTGLPGIVAASLGAEVVQTDRHEMALDLCERNGLRNGIPEIERRQADWSDWHDYRRYDWIIGSDILYNEPLHAQIGRILLRNLAPGGRVLLSDPLRPASLRLLERLQDQGWTVSFSRWSLDRDEVPRTVGIFELTPGTRP